MAELDNPFAGAWKKPMDGSQAALSPQASQVDNPFAGAIAQGEQAKLEDTPGFFGSIVDTLHQIPLIGKSFPTSSELKSNAQRQMDYIQSSGRDAFINAQLGAPTAGLKEGLTQFGEGAKQLGMAAGNTIGAVSDQAYLDYAQQVMGRRVQEANSPQAAFNGYGLGKGVGQAAPFAAMPYGTIAKGVTTALAARGVPQLWAAVGGNIAAGAATGAAAGQLQFVNPEDQNQSRIKNTAVSSLVGTVLAAAPYVYAPGKTWALAQYNKLFKEGEFAKEGVAREAAANAAGIDTVTAAQATKSKTAAGLESSAASLHQDQAATIRNKQLQEAYGAVRNELENLPVQNASNFQIGKSLENVFVGERKRLWNNLTSDWKQGLQDAADLTKGQKFIPVASFRDDIKSRVADLTQGMDAAEAAAGKKIVDNILSPIANGSSRGRISVEDYNGLLITANEMASKGNPKMRAIWKEVRSSLNSNLDAMKAAGNLLPNQVASIDKMLETRANYATGKQELNSIFEIPIQGSKLNRALNSPGYAKEKFVDMFNSMPESQAIKLMNIVDTAAPEVGTMWRRAAFEGALEKSVSAARTADKMGTYVEFDPATFIDSLPKGARRDLMFPDSLGMAKLKEVTNAVNIINREFTAGGLSNSGELADISGLAAGTAGQVAKTGEVVGSNVTFLGRYMPKYWLPRLYAKWLWDPKAREALLATADYLQKPMSNASRASSALSYLWTTMDIDAEENALKHSAAVQLIPKDATIAKNTPIKQPSTQPMKVPQYSYSGR